MHYSTQTQVLKFRVSSTPISFSSKDMPPFLDDDDYEPSQLRGMMEDEAYGPSSPRPRRLAAEVSIIDNARSAPKRNMHYTIINHILFSLFNGGACDSQLTDSQFTDQLLGTSESLENAAIKKNIKVEQDETSNGADKPVTQPTESEGFSSR